MKKAMRPNPLFDTQPGRREVRSFVLREGRLTDAQARAFDQCWPVFGIENNNQLIDHHQCFGRDAPLVVEVGFGDGEAIAYSAKERPDLNFLGIEVHRPGVGRLLQRIQEAQLQNIRIVCADAVQVLKQRIRDDAISMFRLYFPDPWPKKKHHKRRIVQPEFIQLVQSKMQTGGLLHFATDWEPYAEHMMEVLENLPGLSNQQAQGGFSSRPAWRCETKFERRGLKLGHGVWDLLFHSDQGIRSQI